VLSNSFRVPPYSIEKKTEKLFLILLREVQKLRKSDGYREEKG
jgi:hypothetical protein